MPGEVTDNPVFAELGAGIDDAKRVFSGPIPSLESVWMSASIYRHQLKTW